MGTSLCRKHAGEDVILMETSFNLAIPEIAASELVKVTAFRHQNVARSK